MVLASSSLSWFSIVFPGPGEFALAEDLHLLPLSQEASSEGTVWLFLVAKTLPEPWVLAPAGRVGRVSTYSSCWSGG